MKNLQTTLIIALCLLCISGNSQTSNFNTLDCDFPTNISCSSAIQLCDNYDETYFIASTECGCAFGTDDYWINNSVPRPTTHNGVVVPNSTYFAYWNTGLFYSFYVDQIENIELTISVGGPVIAIEIYGPFAPEDYPCNDVSIGSNIYYGDQAAAFTPQPGPNLVNASFNNGMYYIVIYPRDCGTSYTSVDIDFDQPFAPCVADPPPPCSYCIEKFSPIPGKEYVISGWAKEFDNTGNLLTFNNPKIKVSYPTTTSSSVTFSTSGKIIDGWQKIEGVFTIPATAVDIKFDLLNLSLNPILFDDIRVQPFNSSMKTFVYDPVTMRLVAEQDERNYSTFYEYDEEGRLSQVKRETERGIKTVQAIRQNTAIDD